MTMNDEGKNLAGRPSSFNEELADIICERMADGESLRAICREEGMPSKSAVFRWLGENERFRDQYASARETQADSIFDEILDISDNGSNDYMERLGDDGAAIGWRENGEAIRRSVLRVDARKWMAGKLRPKKYGDKLTNVLEGGDNPIRTVDETDPRKLAQALALILAEGSKAEG